MTKEQIIKLISKGDKRSVVGVSQVVSILHKNPKLIGKLLNVINPDKEALNMRILDAIEKVTRNNFDLLRPYKKIFLDKLLYQQQKEIRWHVAQIVPRLSLTKRERKPVVDILINDYLCDSSSIVKVNTLQALTEMALSDDKLINHVQPIIKQAIRTGSLAMKARGKKLSLILSSR